MKKMYLLLSCLLALNTWTAAGENRLYIQDFSIDQGATIDVSIMLDNDVTDFASFQADLYLPDGLELVQQYNEDDDEYYTFSLTTRARSRMAIGSSIQSDGAVRLMLTQTMGSSMQSIKDTSGALVTFQLKAAGAVAGTKNIRIEKIIFTTVSATQYVLENSQTTVNIIGSQPVVLATGIALNTNTLELTALGQTATLTATVSPSDVTNGSVTWTSNNMNVASVSSTGVVNAVSNGTTIITATTADGTNLSAECTVTVNIQGDEPEPLKMLYIENTSANRGTQIELPVQLDNGEESITAFQFDVELPDGLTLMGCSLSDRKADHGNPSPKKQSDGSYRFTTFSGNNSPFSGTEGVLLYLTLNIDSEMPIGNYEIKLKNIELSTQSKAIEQPDCKSQFSVLEVLMGDVNNDGKVSIFDAVQIVNYILGNNPSPFVFFAADVDRNGKITIFDAVSTVNIILNQGALIQVDQTPFLNVEPQ